MSEPTRSNQTAQPEVETDDVAGPSAGETPICYRMEPAKHLLSGEPCGQACPPVSLDDGNKMPPCLLSEQQHSVIDLDRVCRVALMVTPQRGTDAIDEAWEAVSTIRAILKQQAVPMTVTKQAVFVRSADDIESFQQLFRAYYGAPKKSAP